MILMVVLGLLVMQQAPARDTRAGTTADATGRIVGMVTSDEPRPRPLRRARVTLLGSGSDHFDAVVTGDDGRFAFDRLPPGRYTLTAIKAAYVTMSYGASRPGRAGTGIQVAAGQTATAALRLPPGAVITGTVLDVDGRPAPGLSVSALSPRLVGVFGERQWLDQPGVPSSTSDDRGVYRIYGLPAGEYIVSAQVVSRPGFAGSTDVRMMVQGVPSRMMSLSSVLHPGVTDTARAARIAVRAGEERAAVDIQLAYAPLASVSGTVSAPAGWGPARVTLWRTDDTGQSQTAPVVSADDQGRFVFGGIRPGNYRLAARAAQAPSGGRGSAVVGDVQYASMDIAIDGEDVEGLALALQPGLSIAGRVEFESSQSVPPRLPQLSVPSPLVLHRASGGWPMPAITVEDGRFLIRGVTPGSYRIASPPRGVRAPIGPWWLKSIVVAGRDLLDAPVDLQQNVEDAVATFTDRVSEVAGILRDAAGAPISECQVVVFPVDSTGWFVNSRRIASVRTARDGRWSIMNLPPGEYRATAADLDQNEWFDPVVLERLLPAAVPIRVAGPEKYSVDLVIR